MSEYGEHYYLMAGMQAEGRMRLSRLLGVALPELRAPDPIFKVNLGSIALQKVDSEDVVIEQAPLTPAWKDLVEAALRPRRLNDFAVYPAGFKVRSDESRGADVQIMLAPDQALAELLTNLYERPLSGQEQLRMRVVAEGEPYIPVRFGSAGEPEAGRSLLRTPDLLANRLEKTMTTSRLGLTGLLALERKKSTTPRTPQTNDRSVA